MAIELILRWLHILGAIVLVGGTLYARLTCDAGDESEAVKQHRAQVRRKWSKLVAASVGAFFGDMLSYALGRRFRAHLLDIWPFSRYPRLMERGTRFFRAHGAKSVVAGRFIGPLRPIISGKVQRLTPDADS